MKRYQILTAFIMCVCVLGSIPQESGALDITTTSRFIAVEDQKVISMDFKDANLNDVLKVFSQQSGMNFIAESGISAVTVNLYLDQVPVEEALERILTANNLTYELKPGSNIFVVKPLIKAEVELMTRVYQLKHASVSTSKIYQTLSALVDTSDTGSSSSSGSSAEQTASTLLNAIQNLLSPNGTVIEDARTNSLIVTDIPTQFLLIENTIAQLDVRVPQILIEAEMLDISKSTADLLGAKFGNTPLTFHGGTKQGTFPFDETTLEQKGYEYATDQYTTSKLDFVGLQFTLQFLRTQTDTKNLARPRILTLNNETALIQIKTDEAIGQASTTDNNESGQNTTTDEAERVETGVFLKVTPQANIHSGEITMAIEPKVVITRASSIGDGTIKDPEERGTKSILRIRDGDTIVIGGLIRSSVDTIKTKVPLLGSIPVIGSAFRHKDNTENERELIIFITPHILKEDYALNTGSSAGKYTEREQQIPVEKYRAINSEFSILNRQR